MAKSTESFKKDVSLLRKDLRRLASLHDRIRELAMILEQRCGNLESALKGDPPPLTIRERERERFYEDLLKRMAARGADLELRFEHDVAFVRIDGGKEFALPSRRAHFLEIISNGEGNEGASPWHSHRDIADLLNHTPGLPISPGSITNLVHRLRETLKKHGENPFYVETQETKGVRFHHWRRRIDRDLEGTSPLRR